jgi:putative ABC transport system permease protein
MTGRHALGSPNAAGPAARAGARQSAGGRRPLRIRTGGWWRALTGSATAAVVVFGLLTCACGLLAVVGPRAGEEFRTGAFHQLVKQTPAADKTIFGSVGDDTLSAGITPGIDDKMLAYAQALLQANLAKLPLGPARASWSALTTPNQAAFDRHFGGSPLQENSVLELTYRSSLAGNVRVVSGALPAGTPAPPGSPATLQAAVTAATARQFGLTVGSVVSLLGDGDRLKISGIVAPRDPAAPFWTFDPQASAPQAPSPALPYWQGAAFLAPSAVLALQNVLQQSTMQVSFMFPMNLSSLTASQALSLGNAMPNELQAAGDISIHSEGGVPAPVQVALGSSVVNLIASYMATGRAVDQLLDLLSVSLAAVGSVVVLLAAWLLAEKRREEFAVLRARGASRWQLAKAALAGSAIVAVPGLVAGVVMAIVLTPGSSAPLSWVLAALVAAVALTGPVLIVVWTHRRHAQASVRADRTPGRASSARRLVAESALVLASAGGLIVLRDQGLGAHGTDLYPAAAPILVAVPVAVILLRLYPLAIRGLLRLTGDRASATAFLGLARAARVSATAILPAFAMILAFGLVSFAGMVRGAVVRGEVAASWQAVGADAILTSSAPFTPAQLHAVAALPGVSRVLRVATEPGKLASAGFAQSGWGVLVASPAQYARLVAGSPLPAVPARFAAGRVAGGIVPVLASPGLAAKLGAGPVSILAGASYQQVRLTVQVVGLAAAMSGSPAVAGQGFSNYLVLPATALGSRAPAPLALMIRAPEAGPALAGKLAHVAPRAQVTSRPAVLAQLESAPLQHGTYLALALGGDAAAAACLLVFLLTLLMAAPSRQMTLARMNTMGLSVSQGRRLALVEALPQVLTVLAGGVLCAVALAPLLAPALNLSVFTGSSARVHVQAEPVWLAGTAAGLLVLALVTLAAQTIAASRGTARSLRIGG